MAAVRALARLGEAATVTEETEEDREVAAVAAVAAATALAVRGEVEGAAAVRAAWKVERAAVAKVGGAAAEKEGAGAALVACSVGGVARMGCPLCTLRCPSSLRSCRSTGLRSAQSTARRTET